MIVRELLTLLAKEPDDKKILMVLRGTNEGHEWETEWEIETTESDSDYLTIVAKE